VKHRNDLSSRYNDAIIEEGTMEMDKRALAHVGKMDARKHLESTVHKLMGSNIVQCLGTMLDTVVF